jgi:hypothetical protein
MTHRIMTTQTNFKPTISQPLGKAVFAHCQSQRDRQTQLAKSKNSSRKTLVALSKSSMLLYKFPTTRQQKNKNKAVSTPPPFLSFGISKDLYLI